MIRAIVQLMPGHPDEILRNFGIVTAQTLGEGVYANLVREGASDRSLYALWASMHDTGTLSVTDQESHEMSFELIGFGYPSREMCAIVSAYIEETFRMGELFAKVAKLDCRLSGSPKCCWRATW